LWIVKTEHTAAQDRHEARLPVVSVNDVVVAPFLHHPVERRLREECEAFGIVGVIMADGAVQVLALEESGVVDEQCAYTVADRREDRGVVRPGTDSHLQSAKMLVRADAAVPGHHDVDVVPEPDQGARERPEDVRQAARLRVRRGFGGDHQEAHRGIFDL
jgi:hypothetical protein